MNIPGKRRDVKLNGLGGTVCKHAFSLRQSMPFQGVEAMVWVSRYRLAHGDLEQRAKDCF